LAWYALTTLGAFLTMFLNRALAAANLQREILVATVVAVVVTIIFDLILLRPLAQGGIALAALIGIYLNALMYIWYLRRRFPAYDLKALARQQGRIVLCGIICIIVAVGTNQILPTEGLKSLILLERLTIKVAIALVAYWIAARFLARDELRDTARIIKALFHRQRPGTPAA
jgi:putative peptidoglycan lipid II flippase